MNKTNDKKFLQWQYAADEIYQAKYCTAAPRIGIIDHNITTNIPAATDVSSCYLYPEGNMNKKLEPGTSGSVAIDQNDQVVGIH
jgi:hypothetical protein